MCAISNHHKQNRHHLITYKNQPKQSTINTEYNAMFVGKESNMYLTVRSLLTVAAVLVVYAQFDPQPLVHTCDDTCKATLRRLGYTT